MSAVITFVSGEELFTIDTSSFIFFENAGSDFSIADGANYLGISLIGKLPSQISPDSRGSGQDRYFPPYSYYKLGAPAHCIVKKRV